MLVQLKTGDFKIGDQDTILSTSGIGSCVVVCLRDSQNLWGAMAHIPYPNDSKKDPNPFRKPGLSPDSAIPAMLAPLEKQGSRLESLEAHVIGAGNMFTSSDTSGIMQKMVQQVLDQVLQELAQRNIAIKHQITGGNLGRSVRFEIGSGRLVVTSVDGQSEVL